MDANEYKARVRAHARQKAALEGRKDAEDYKERGMKIGMPFGCWVWIGILGFGVVALFRKIFFE